MSIKKLLRNNKGQAIVELAIIIPILLIILMSVFEFGRIFNAYLIITNASREGARSAALSNNDLQIIQTVNSSVFYLDKSELTISVTPSESARKRGTNVIVNLQYNLDIIVPIIDNFIPNPFPLKSQTVMRVE